MSFGPLFDWPFDDLYANSYDLIVADPPWDFENWSESGEGKNAKAHYSCMDIHDIMRLPVMDLASDDCLLWLWATNPMLPQGLDTLKNWGFDFCTAGTWVKSTKHGKRHFGTGYVFRSSNEPILIGKRGSPKLTAKNIRSTIEGKVREHSRKPDEAYEAATALMPNARKLELFSRQPRKGWTTWGNEVHKFDEVQL